MKRGIFIAGVLAAATAIALPGASPSAAQPGQWQPGVNYTVLRFPRASTVPKGKVEVNEVFWYGCGHCYALDPVLEAWKLTKPSFIEFVRIPVIWGPTHKQYARLFYTLQKLGLGDLHPKVFDAIHQNGRRLTADTDAQARELHRAFLEEYGVDRKRFDEAYDAPDVAKQVDLAEQLTARYEVAAVPTLIVAGAYSTSVSEAGGESQLLALVNDLATREQRR